MKKFLWIFVPVLILSLFTVSVSASSQFVYDNANILTDDEETYLESLAAAESGKYGISIVILTESGIGNTDPMVYAADFYDFGGFEPDGVIMFLDMGERDWRIVNSGTLIDVIGDYELDYIRKYAVPWFSDGDYKTGFEQYVIIASALADRYANGSFTGDYYLEGYNPEAYKAGEEAYSSDNSRTPEPGYDRDYGYNSYYESPGVGGMYYFIAAIAAVIIAFVICQCFKSQLNTAVPKNNASRYFDENNAVLTVSKDKFLYSRVTKIKRDTDENRPSGRGHSGGMHSFSGSSGRPHSGGGGKF